MSQIPSGKVGALTLGLGLVTILLVVSPLGLGMDLPFHPSLTVGPWENTDKITPDDAEDDGRWGVPDHAYANFGSSIAMDGSLMAVGTAPDAFADAMDWVYLVEQNPDGDWNQVQKFYPEGDDGSIGFGERMAFGYSVALDEDAGVLVVGDPGYNRSNDPFWIQGAAYVYERLKNGSWEQVAAFKGVADPADDGGPRFGHSVAVDGDRMVVAANNEDVGTVERAGVVYVYERSASGWEQTQRLPSPDPQPHATFGGVRDGVALQGTTLLVGEPHSSLETGVRAGKVHAFELTEEHEWTHTETLLPPDPGGRPNPGSASFGLTVSLDDGTAVIGDPAWHSLVDSLDEDYLVAYHSGRAFVFEEGADGWAFSSELAPRDSTPAQWFGWNVDIRGDTVAVSAFQAPHAQARVGAAWVFENVGGTWLETARLQHGEPDYFDHFGWGLATNGEAVAVGSPFDDNRRDEVPYPFSTWSEYAPGPVSLCGILLHVDQVPECGAGKNAGSVYVFERLGGVGRHIPNLP